MMELLRTLMLFVSMMLSVCVCSLPGDDGQVVQVEESSLVDVIDGGGVGDGGDGRGSLHTRVFQQSVTLTASMWPGENGTNTPSASSGSSPWGFWRISSDRLPLLVGVFCGGALVVFLLLTFIIYRCCIMPRREKHYCK